MTLPEFSVRRPVTILVTTLTLAIFGALAWQQLSVELLPDLNYPTLTIQTEYADAAPISVEQFVTRPVEEGVGVIPGVREMRSVSRAGVSEVILEFEWDEPMDLAAMEVREKLGLVELPREADRPRVLRFDPSLDPIVRLALSGDRSLDDLRQLAERWFKPRLEAIRGVAAAKIRGGLDPEIQVEADEDRLAALGLTLDDLAVALRADNVDRPGGTLKDWGAVFLVRTLHEFRDLQQIRRTVVREVDGRLVRVEDVAQVRRGHRDRDEITRDGGTEVVEIALHREGSANTVQVAAEIREALIDLRGEMSDDLKLSLLTDQSTYIAGAISEVRQSALLGGLLALLVLYFFLRDPSATAIIVVTIPISVVATFLPMYRAGVTVNIMSLGGLALGIGMLVDNSIVVLEAIDRHRRAGVGRREAARRGGSEVAGAVIAATLTTICVFLPIVFVKGVAGQLFYDLAVTICFSLLASLLVSLTLIPTLSSFEPEGMRRITPGEVWRGSEVMEHGGYRFLGMNFGHLGAGRFMRIVSLCLLPLRFLAGLLVGAGIGTLWVIVRAVALIVFLTWSVVRPVFDVVAWPATRLIGGLSSAYPTLLAAVLRVRGVVLVLGVLLFALALAAVPRLGTELVPDLAQGEFAFRLRLSEGSTLETTASIVERIEQRLTGRHEFTRVFSTVGSLPSTASGRQTLGENLAQINFVLAERGGARTERQAVQLVRDTIELFADVEAELVRPSVLTVAPPVAVHLFSENLQDLDVAARRTAAVLQGVAGIRDVATSSEPGNPEITVELDRERAAGIGVRVEPLATSLRTQIQGDVVGQFREDEERLDIRLRSLQRWRDHASDVGQLRFRLPNGSVVPVSSVATVTTTRGPAAIHRVDGGRVAEVTAKVEAGDLGRVIEDTRTAVAGLDLPADTVAELAGQDEELTVSYNSLKLAIALAVFLVYVVMAVQFESFRYPLVILLSVPLGIIGVVAALMLSGTSISVLALIGVVMLAGIVVNNAIVLVDAVNRRRQAGEPLAEALVSGAAERLRPILMTTATTVLALLPLAIGLGDGGELRRPLAITVIGGLTGATLLTLVVIPCLYRILSPGPTTQVNARDGYEPTTTPVGEVSR